MYNTGYEGVLTLYGLSLLQWKWLIKRKSRLRKRKGKESTSQEKRDPNEYIGKNIKILKALFGIPKERGKEKEWRRKTI